MKTFIQHLNSLSQKKTEKKKATQDAPADFSVNNRGQTKDRRSVGPTKIKFDKFEKSFDKMGPNEKIELLEKYAAWDENVAAEYFHMLISTPAPLYLDDSLHGKPKAPKAA